MRSTTRQTGRRPQRHPIQAQPTHPAGMARLPFAATTLASAMVLALGGTAQAATYTVTNTNDAGTGSLRQAIIDANANSDSDPDDIVFDAGLSLPATITLTGGELAITDDLTIAGPGAGQLTIDGGGTSRLFNLDGSSQGGIDVNLSGLTLTNGKAERGGAIESNQADLTLSETTISGNRAEGFLCNDYLCAYGGGIEQRQGDLTVTSSTISGNTAQTTGDYEYHFSRGGGILQSGGDLTIADSSITGNTVKASGKIGTYAHIDGGGIFQGSGVAATVTRSTISGNLATNATTGGIIVYCLGGGIFSRGNLTITESTIFGNAAEDQGNAEHSVCGGGGVVNWDSGPITVTNSTVSGNTGEGIVLTDTGGNIVINGSTINDDIGSNSRVTLHNSIVTGALPDQLSLWRPGAKAGRGSVFATYSLIQNPPVENKSYIDENGQEVYYSVILVDDSAAPGSNLYQVGPMLGLLLPNGGPTETMALLAGSPAINTGDPGDYLPTDQRGVSRPQGPALDIGAFEVSVGGGALVDYFDQAVAAGDLVGSGNGNSADGRLNALRNMLLAADDFIAEGEIDEACTQLQDAYERTDGATPPPDFVEGEASDDLATEIAATRSALGCD
jgi:parallel beta-helix repeat protein